MTIESNPAVGAVSSNLEEGFANGGPVVRAFPGAGTPLLNGFYFQYTNDAHELAARLDHHVQQVMLMPGFPEPGRIELGLHENGSDADYYFKVRHVLVQNNRIRSFSRGLDIGRGRNVEIPIDRPAGDNVFVLCGFQLAYRGDDHHIDEIGIVESGGAVKVRINDRNDDDSFVFRLRYAYVPLNLIAELGTEQGTDSDAQGGARRHIPAGTAVLRGFNMNFRSSDHHIRNVGITLDNRHLTVFFGDKNGDDSYDWMAQWATLAE
jgi:hypothetical protein